MPDIEEDLDVEIADDDIRIDTYRSSGAGGQHINKTSSAIRITHFPTGSEDTIDKGRLGEECSRLSAIFEEVTEDSLVLCDESLSSTGSFEAAYIASEVLQGFSMARCRGIFSTHLHDLAASVDSINASCVPNGGVKIDNLVAAIEKGSRSFKILREKPDGKSYARDIAEKYGLSLDKIMTKIKK